METKEWLKGEKERFWNRVGNLVEADPALLKVFREHMRGKRRIALSAVVGSTGDEALMRKAYAISLAFLLHKHIDELVDLYWQAKRGLSSSTCDEVENFVRDRFKACHDRPLEEVLGLL